jgi:hypothetical protein
LVPTPPPPPHRHPLVGKTTAKGSMTLYGVAVQTFDSVWPARI